MLILLYSLALSAALLLASPWWLWRMARTSRYREGLAQRLGRVPLAWRASVSSKPGTGKTVWLHAVSVGETLAATRLVTELEAALGADWRVVVSTTTRTGHALAQQRFGAERVFYMPLDFAFSVRAYLDVLQPAALLLMESELWPRLLHECGRRGIPVAVVNARVSDRSFTRALRVRKLWSRLVRRPVLWMAQSEQDARRLLQLGARPEQVYAIGNLKYDTVTPKENSVAHLLRIAANGRPVLVAGSTVDRLHDRQADENELLITAWEGKLRAQGVLLVLAPRQPQTFDSVFSVASEYRAVRATALGRETDRDAEIVVLDTIGDLASVYGVATVAFIGGSLLPRHGHNPLEAAQFGVPVVMGDSVENFRDIVSKMQASDAICIVRDERMLEAVILGMLLDGNAARAMGERGRAVFAAQQGATQRAVALLLPLLRGTQAGER